MRRTHRRWAGEATAIGNAAMQAIAVGELSNLQEARALVRRSSTVTVYEPGERSPWDAAYARFLRLVADVTQYSNHNCC